MSKRSTALERVQVGLETVAGTGVAADKWLMGFDRFVLNPIEPFADHTPAGSEVAMEDSRQKVHSEWEGEGPICYRTLPYFLASLLHSDVTAPYLFEPNPFGVDTIKTL